MWTRLSAFRVPLLLALRMTLAAAATFFLGSWCGLSQISWGVLTAILVTQTSVGGSLQTATARVIGSLCGACAASAVVTLFPPHGFWSVAAALILTVAPLSVVAAFTPEFRIAPVTGTIVLFGATALGVSPVELALQRMVEIVLGCGVGLVVSLAVAPARAQSLLREAARQVCLWLAAEWELRAAPSPGHSVDPDELDNRLQTALARLTVLTQEALQERRTHLASAPDPQPLLRTLRRLRGDALSLGRALVEPWPEPIRQRLEPTWSALARSTAETLRETAQALVSRTPPPSTAAVEANHRAYVAAVDALRQEGLTRALSADAAGRVLGLTFVWEGLTRDLADLVGRVAEMARSEERGLPGGPTSGQGPGVDRRRPQIAGAEVLSETKVKAVPREPCG